MITALWTISISISIYKRQKMLKTTAHHQLKVRFHWLISKLNALVKLSNLLVRVWIIIWDIGVKNVKILQRRYGWLGTPATQPYNSVQIWQLLKAYFTASIQHMLLHRHFKRKWLETLLNQEQIYTPHRITTFWHAHIPLTQWIKLILTTWIICFFSRRMGKYTNRKNLDFFYVYGR